MNKKQVKSLFLFLTLLMVTLAITAVSATDTNDTTSVSDNSNTQSVALDEKTGNDYSLEKNNEQMYNYDDSIDTTTKENYDTTSVLTKSITKNNKTGNKEYTYKSYSTLTVGSTKSVYVGDTVSIYGRLSSYSSRIPYSTVEIDVINDCYYVTTNAYGDYKLTIKGSDVGTNYISAYYYGSSSYYSSSASTTFNVNKKTSNLTIGCTKSTSVGDKLSIYGKLSARGIGLAYKNVEINVDGKIYHVTTSQYGNYNLKVTALDEGYNYVIATYYGSDIYTYDTASTYFTANNKNVITIGSTKSVYVGDKVSVYGKLTSKGKNIANAKVTVTLDYTTYTTYTSKYGNYNLKVTPSSSGTKTLTVKYTDNNSNSVYNTTTFQSNKKITNLTVGSTKSVYVGDTVSVYGKLSARGIGLAYKSVTIDVEGVKYYVTTSKYGNYNLKVTAQKEGYNYITATYGGTNIYSSDSEYTYVYASKKISTITLGSTKTVTQGKTVSLYGKLSVRGIGIAYKEVVLDINGDTYYTTTNKYGDYSYSYKASKVGTNTITVSYAGTKFYKASSATTTFTVTKNGNIIELYTYELTGPDPKTSIRVGKDYFTAWYQWEDRQNDKGVHVVANPIDAQDMGDPPYNLITDAVFYFKNDEGKIYSDSYDYGYGDSMYHSLHYGYTPYKVVVTYRLMTDYERYLWYNGYGYNPKTGQWYKY